MRFRLLAVFFAAALAACASTLTVDQLFAFMRSSADQIREGRATDREVANLLGKTTLSERLDDRAVEEMEALGLGPRTMDALRKLRDQSKALSTAPLLRMPEKPLQPPPPTSLEQAAIIDEARAYALAYSQALPNFICTQHTFRSVAPPPVRRLGATTPPEPSWQQDDTLTIRLSYFDQKEEAKLIMRNNTITTQDYQNVGGSTTTGVFGSMMKDIFERSTEAHFEWARWATLRNRLSMVFGYKVSQARSQWHIVYDKRLDVVPAYYGLVFVDHETHAITRVTLEADDLPAGFPVRSASTVLDYDWVDISGHRFLLPSKSHTVMASDYMSKLDDQYVNYRKYTVESELKFDTEPSAPLPEDKETPVTQVPPPSPAKKKK
jgi:hypothetical protein